MRQGRAGWTRYDCLVGGGRARDVVAAITRSTPRAGTQPLRSPMTQTATPDVPILRTSPTKPRCTWRPRTHGNATGTPVATCTAVQRLFTREGVR